MHALLILPVSSVSLVFGLDWLPLLGGRATRAAYRLARQQRATHLVIAGDVTAAVGLARLRRADRSAPLHSAAQNVARLFASGTVALLLELDAAHYWLVAVHEGAVVARTDRIYQSENEARNGLDELRQAFPRLVVLGQAQSPQAPGLAAIAAVSDGGSSLLRAGRWHHGLPRWLRRFGLAFALALLLPKAWMAVKPAVPVAPSTPPMDSVQAWRHATELAGRAIAVHGVPGTQAVLEGLYRLPLRLAGWSLAGAGCEPLLGHWQCRARYMRLGPQASNETLLRQAPSAWLIDFVSIDQAEPVWRVSPVAVPLARAPVNSARENERHLWSALQSIKPAFSAMQLGRPVPLSIAAPRDAQGRPIPRPDEVPVYTLRGVRFDGPLRSASVLLPYTGSISWKKVTLSLHDGRMADLKSSRLHVSLQGDLYEVQSAGPAELPGPGAPQAPLHAVEFAAPHSKAGSGAPF